MGIQQKIRQYLLENGLKMNYVAEKSNIKPKRFYRLISGDAPLVVEEYEMICNGLGINPGYFFE